jgi:hypothetical protein
VKQRKQKNAKAVLVEFIPPNCLPCFRGSG